MVRRRVAFAAALLAASLAATPASAAKLWIAWDSGAVHACRPTVEDMFACVLGATQYTAMAAQYSTGRALTFGGTTVLAAPCATTESSSASVATDVATFQCVEDQAHFDLHDDDVLLYYPNHTGCNDGRNHWHIPIASSGHTARIEVALSYSGTSCTCQTVFGFHEVYEASAQASAGDCCNGQAWTGCPATPSPYGWYNLSGCASGTFNVQAISPARAEFDASQCTRLTVDRAALCAQTRAVRTAGRCVGDSLETCPLALTTTDCRGMGCSETPTPHCNTFAATCRVSAPSRMCSGASGAMTVTCTNDGALPWDAMLAIGAATPGGSSLFADPTWIAPAVAARVDPAAVAPGATGAFAVPLRAPDVIAPITYTLRWSLQEIGGAVYPTPSPDALSTTITVAPCEPRSAMMDAGVSHDAGADGGQDTGAEGDVVHPPPGCGCRTLVPSRGRSAEGLAAASLALAIAARRRRRA